MWLVVALLLIIILASSRVSLHEPFSINVKGDIGEINPFKHMSALKNAATTQVSRLQEVAWSAVPFRSHVRSAQRGLRRKFLGA